MTLDEWMNITKTSNSEAGRQLGCAAETVRRYRAKERDPDLDTQRRIFALSGGQVTPNDWAGVGPRPAASKTTENEEASCPAP